MVNGEPNRIHHSPFTIYHLQFFMMGSGLKINLLGSLQVTIGEETAVFRTDAERILLAYLAAHQGVPQRRDTLAGLLSPDRPDKEALTYLRNRLTRLRKVIGDDTAPSPSRGQAVPPYLAIDRKQITLRTASDINIDVTKFEQHLATVETHAHRQLAGCPTCLTRLQGAVNLVRGELLAGLNFPSDTWEAWLIAQREHVQQKALAAMTDLREAQMTLGEWTAVLDIAQRQLILEPWQEAAHRAMMLAHIQLGDRNAALAQFEQCKQRLWDELGVEPEDETTTLLEKIKAADGNIIRSPLSVPDNLPLQTGLFFGREAEQAQLLRRLVDPKNRLITLVGTGGIGKTRLSIEVGRQAKMSFADGVWFVPLDAVNGGTEQIKIAVGEAIGLGQGPSQSAVGKQLTGDQVLAILRDKQMLLIFDNSEPVLAELAFIPEWLRRAPDIAILATSREPLNFQAESVVMLDGLPTGGLSTDKAKMKAAEALFAERGRMARADFALTAENLLQVRHICKLVDGSPLGISLAAAWVRRRSLTQISAEISRSLDFLSTRLRDIDPRHRSMRAVFETSWQLLSPQEQGVLAALSVFPTTFTAVAAEQVAGATLHKLDLLCEKSLLQQQHEPERYVMHSLVRQFAADKLAARTPEVEHDFADYFYQFSRNHQDDYAALQPEWQNFLTAVAKAHALQSWQQVVDFVTALDEPWFRQIRFQDMRQGLALALTAASNLQDQPALARTLLRLGEIEMELNDYVAAEKHLADAMQRLMRLEDSLGIAQGNYLYGRIKTEMAQDEEALALFAKSKPIFEEEGNWIGVAKNLNLMAFCHMRQNPDLDTACMYLSQSIKMQRNSSPSATYIEALRYMARAKSILGEYEEAEICLVEASHVSQSQQDIGEYAAVLFDQIVLCRRQKQFDVALKYGYECLELFRKLGSLRWEALVKMQLGILHQAKQNWEQALLLFHDCQQRFGELGDLYEQAYAYYFLYLTYEEIGDLEQSLLYKQNAVRLNITLNDSELHQRLQ
jgi:predicted ATPase/DNA-binding SARP family transcriptional activator/tetratricopeptide (TPR) repeat protein